MSLTSTPPGRVLITGSSGFIGHGLLASLGEQWPVTAATRSNQPLRGIRNVAVGEIGSKTDWSDALLGATTVIHLAGAAHGSGKQRIPDFQQVNVLGTINLAKQALNANVKRFIFLSSIGVNGQANNSPFSECSIPNPSKPYAFSKYYAECALQDIFRGTQTELVVVRPPLVYAGHAPGNFRLLLKAVAGGYPLPFAGVENKRSMISLDNLVSFLMLCVLHPSAGNNLFVISDLQAVSTCQILKHVANGMQKKLNLFRVPDSVLRGGAEITRRAGVYTQLCETLTIDPSKACSVLNWAPVTSTGGALEAAGKAYLENLGS